MNEIWNNLPKFYPCELDEFIIMPDHIHGIIILDNKGGANNKSLSTIIQRFKTFTAKKINELLDGKNKFHWQKSFYDRIIRNERDLYLIRNYIHLNPMKWELEKDLPENLDLWEMTSWSFRKRSVKGGTARRLFPTKLKTILSNLFFSYLAVFLHNISYF